MDTRDSSTKRTHSQIVPEFSHSISIILNKQWHIINRNYFLGFLQNEPLYIIASGGCQIRAIPLLLLQHHLMVQISSHIFVLSMLSLSIVTKTVAITQPAWETC